MIALEKLLQGSPYLSYSYSYPHKTAYRPLRPAIPLDDLWQAEGRDALFLYLHVPFCEMRCGFCNLFTTANPTGDFEAAYLDALERQAARVKDALGHASFARVAIGGGTPTYLSAPHLRRLIGIAHRLFGIDLNQTPVSVETSPFTASLEKLRLLRECGVDRISIGVQSFNEAEVAASGRAQENQVVRRALELIRSLDFPTLNIDLIYGLEHQTVESWLTSLRNALRFQPEEIYIYPLYVRPLTGLGRHLRSWDDIRLACYRAGRDLLESAGYEQLSMRMFRHARAPEEEAAGPVYCCQDDGMVGLGCGARSYTRTVHCSTPYAVGAANVRQILTEYIEAAPESFDTAAYGFLMDAEEQRRRYAIQSLLQAEGLTFAAYRQRFGTCAMDDLPQLSELIRCGLAGEEDGRLRLTVDGMERSDMIGPWMYSTRVNELMRTYTLR